MREAQNTLGPRGAERAAAPPDVAWRGVLLIVVLTGIALRVCGLNSQSLWGDEIWSVYTARDAGFAEIAEVMRIRDVHPPAYDFLLAVVLRAFGDAPTVVRMPSVIAGSLAVIALFRLGRLLFGVRTGLFAAALLAVSSTSIYYSQETRSYAWLLLLSIASSECFARAFRPPADPSWRLAALVPYWLFAVALEYTHYFGILVLGVHAVIAVFSVGRHGRGWVRLSVFPLIGLAYVPWLRALMEHMQITQFWIERPTPRSLLDYLAFVFNGHTEISAVAAVVCLLGVLVRWRGAGAASPQVQGASAWTIAWLVVWIALPLGAAYGKSLLSTPVFTNRNLIICFPAFFLLTARAADAVATELLPVSFWRHVAWLGCLAILAGGLQFLGRTDFYGVPNRAQYREAVRAVVDSGIPIDRISVVTTDEFFDYYFEQLAPGVRAHAIAYAPEEIPVMRESLTFRDRRFVWYLQGFTRTGANAVLEQLSVDYVPLRHERFVAVEATLFEKR